MAVSVDVDGFDVVVTITGWSAVWALSKGFRVPLAQVRSAAMVPRDTVGKRTVLRMGGTALPGVVKAGRYSWRGWTEFWVAYRAPDVLAIACVPSAKYDLIVLQVAEPEADAERLRAAAVS